MFRCSLGLVVMLCAVGTLATKTAKFERVQHGLRDGGVEWGSGVHFDGVELEGSDGEKMEIKNDKITEDEVVDKQGKVTKDYLAAKLGFGFQGGVETVANLPEQTTRPPLLSPARRRLSAAPVVKRAVTAAAATTKRGKQHGPARQIAAALAKALQRKEWDEWERKQEPQKQTHYGLLAGRAIWIVGLIIFFLPRGEHDTNVQQAHPVGIEMT